MVVLRILQRSSTQVGRKLLSTSFPPMVSESTKRGLSNGVESRSYEWATELVGSSPADDDEGKLIVFLHGLLGNKRNVKSFASNICKSLNAPGLLMDVRGHGDSQIPDNIRNSTSSSSSPSSLFEDCVSDLHATLHARVPDIEDRELIVMGHSMGGRLTMLYAVTEYVVKPSHIWLLDTVPGRMNSSVQRVLRVAKKVAEDVNAPTNRKDLTHLLVQEHGIDMGTAQWLASAFDPKSPQKFKFDLEVAREMMDEFDSHDFMGWLDQARREQEVGLHLVAGGANPHWEASGSLPLFRSWQEETKDPSRFSFHTLPTAGHWVHIDDPKGLQEAVESVHK